MNRPFRIEVRYLRPDPVNRRMVERTSFVTTLSNAQKAYKRAQNLASNAKASTTIVIKMRQKSIYHTVLQMPGTKQKLLAPPTGFARVDAYARAA
jgi:hypothetical protein